MEYLSCFQTNDTLLITYRLTAIFPSNFCDIFARLPTISHLATSLPSVESLFHQYKNSQNSKEEKVPSSSRTGLSSLIYASYCVLFSVFSLRASKIRTEVL